MTKNEIIPLNGGDLVAIKVPERLPIICVSELPIASKGVVDLIFFWLECLILLWNFDSGLMTYLEPNRAFRNCSARTFPPTIEASHLQIMSANLTVYHPNISTHAYP